MITLCAIYKSTFASLARLETLKGDQEPNIHSINKRWQYLLMHLCIFWGLIWSTCVSFGGWSEAPLCLLGADLKHLCVFWGFIWSIFVSFGGDYWSEALLSALEERNANIPQQEKKMCEKVYLVRTCTELIEKELKCGDKSCEMFILSSKQKWVDFWT